MEEEDLKEDAADNILQVSVTFCRDFLHDCIDTFAYSKESPFDSLKSMLRNTCATPSIFAILEILGRVADLLFWYDEKGKLPKTRTPLDLEVKKMVSKTVAKIETINTKNELRDDLSLRDLSLLLSHAVKKNRLFFFAI